MFDIRSTDQFDHWHYSLRDRRAALRISTRLARVKSGLCGDVKYFDGLGELRIDYGPGYRVYFVKRGQTITIAIPNG